MNVRTMLGLFPDQRLYFTQAIECLKWGQVIDIQRRHRITYLLQNGVIQLEHGELNRRIGELVNRGIGESVKR